MIFNFKTRKMPILLFVVFSLLFSLNSASANAQILDYDEIMITSEYLKMKLISNAATGEDPLSANDRRMLNFFVSLNVNGSFNPDQKTESGSGGVGRASIRWDDVYDKDGNPIKTTGTVENSGNNQTVNKKVFYCTYYSSLEIATPSIAEGRDTGSSNPAGKPANKICTDNGKGATLSTNTPDSNQVTNDIIAICNRKDPKFSREKCLAVIDQDGQSLFGAGRLSPTILQHLYSNTISAGLTPNWPTPDLDTKTMIENYINKEKELRDALDALDASQAGAKLDQDKADNGVKYCYAAGGMSWLFCRLGELLADASTSSFDILEPFLRNDDSVFNQPALTNSWRIFQVTANSILVVAAIIMLISYLAGDYIGSGIGLSNYTIKQTLPKWLIAALLVNASAYFAKAIVDLSNIFGESIFSLLVQWSDWVTNSANFDISGNLRASYGWGDAFLLLIFILLLIIVAVLWIIAFAITMILLTARNALLIVLLPLAPVAFALYALPNTKKYFSMWFNAFIACLMIYPTVALFSGGGLLAYSILSGNILSGADMMKVFSVLIPWSALIIPMLITPIVIFKSLGKVAVAGGFIGMASSMASRFGKKQYEKSAFHRARKQKREKAAEKAVTGEYGNKFSHWLTSPSAAVTGRAQSALRRVSKGVANQAYNAQQKLAKDYEKMAEGVSFHDMQQVSRVAAGDSSINTLNDNQRAVYNQFKHNTADNTSLKLATIAGLVAAAKKESRQLTTQDDETIDLVLATTSQQGASATDLNIIVGNMLDNLDNTTNINTIASIKTNLEFNNGDFSKGRPIRTNTSEAARYDQIYKKNLQREFLTKPIVQDQNKPNTFNLRLQTSSIDPIENPVGHDAIRELYNSSPELKSTIDFHKNSLDMNTRRIIDGF